MRITAAVLLVITMLACPVYAKNVGDQLESGYHVGDKLSTSDQAILCSNPNNVAKARALKDDCEFLRALNCARPAYGLHVIVLDGIQTEDKKEAIQISIESDDGKTRLTVYTDEPSLNMRGLSDYVRKTQPDIKIPCTK